MRVAVVTRDYPPAVGGIATHVEGLVKALRRKGVEVDVYVGRNDVKTLLLPLDIPLRNYDVIHVQSLPYGALVFGVPLVVTVHSPVLEEFAYYRRSAKIAAIPAIALERASISRANAILTVSGHTRTDILDRYKASQEKVRVIGNGVDSERFTRPGDIDEASRARRVIVVCRLEPRKNVEEAIEAVADLPKGTCQLCMVGDGSEMGALVELAKRRGAEEFVSFLGRVKQDTLVELFARSAVFLSTSLSEGFGLSLLEAMAAGCACIASNLPTHRELIEDGVSGMIYDRKSELVSCLRELLSSPKKATLMGAAAQKVASRYTWERVAERVFDVYEQVV